jgi:hypothetical protein
MREDYKNFVYTTDPAIIKAMNAKPGQLRVYIPDKWTSKYEESYQQFDIVRYNQFI